MLSGLSLSDISNVSILALPIYAEDISNRQWYKFGDPTGYGDRPIENIPSHSYSKRQQLKSFGLRSPQWASSLFTRSPKVPELDSKSSAGEESKKVVFGVPLSVSIKYANLAISLTCDDGTKFIFGYVPRVVAICGVFVKEKG